MTHPVSVRFRHDRVSEGLRHEAAKLSTSVSALAEELIDEGLRMRQHPVVAFRSGPTGRRAGLVNGPDIWEVVDGVTGGDVPVAERVQRATRVFGLRPEMIEAAFAYYAEFVSEIDARIEANREAADDAETRWRRRDDLLRR